MLQVLRFLKATLDQIHTQGWRRATQLDHEKYLEGVISVSFPPPNCTIPQCPKCEERACINIESKRSVCFGTELYTAVQHVNGHKGDVNGHKGEIAVENKVGCIGFVCISEFLSSGKPYVGEY